MELIGFLYCFAKIQLGYSNEGCQDLKKALELKFTPAQNLMNQYCNIKKYKGQNLDNGQSQKHKKDNNI